jgi:toxic protein SymE
MVRVACCGISHETNTFVTSALGLTPLGPGGFSPVRGDAVLRLRGGYLGGMMDAADELGYENVGLMYASTQPSGTIADAAYEAMRDEICARLRDAMPVDAVAVENHGAGVAESYEDIEGDLVAAIRAVVGPDVPVVGTFDLHGNISDEMVAHYSYVVPNHLYPHTDNYERGLEAMRMVPRLLGGLRTTAHLEHVPVLLPISMMSTQPGFPAAAMNQFMHTLEQRPGVLDVTVFHGFAWSDISIVGAAVVVTTEDDPALARAVGREAGQWLWDHRAEFAATISRDGVAHDALSDVHTAESAVRAALALTADDRPGEAQPPVCINETADNCGGGSPGDATALLRALLDAGLPAGTACFGWVYDPEVLAECFAAGVGVSIRVSLGGKADASLGGAPIEAEATVRTLTDGRWDARVGSVGWSPGSRRSLGPMARVVIGGVDVLVCGRRSQVFDAGGFTLAGLDINAYKICAVKSSTHFARAGRQ